MNYKITCFLSLFILLKEIAFKYVYGFNSYMAFPVISNQKTNEYLNTITVV